MKIMNVIAPVSRNTAFSDRNRDLLLTYGYNKRKWLLVFVSVLCGAQISKQFHPYRFIHGLEDNKGLKTSTICKDV